MMKVSIKSLFFVSLLLSLTFLFPAVKTHAEEEKQMIVVYKNEQGEEAVQESDAAVEVEYDNLPVAAITADPETIAELDENPDIKYMEPDSKVEISDDGDTAIRSVSQAASSILQQWNLSPIQAQRAWTEGWTGKGVKIAVIDSGIYPHRDLKIAGGYAAVDYTSSYKDDEGHGTHVAGIIGAKHDQYGVDGVAPDAQLYAVKALGSQGEGKLSDLLEGIDWAITNKMDIVNMSMGTERKSKALEDAVNRAYQKGILLVAASGNEGAGHPLDYPAAFDSVIAVSASNAKNGIASFSSVGNEVEFTAPGADIASTYLGSNYAMMSGTSQAAPHVAAMLAILKQQYPNETNGQLRAHLQQYTKDIGSKGRDNLFGYGLIQYQSEQTKQYQQALAAVELSEKTKVREDYDKAQKLTASLSNGQDRKTLQKRLDKVKQALTIQEAKDKVSKAEKSKKKAEIDAAQGAVNKVTDTTEKKNLQKRLDKVKQALTIQEAKDKVSKAEKSKKKTDIDAAQGAVNKVTDTTEKKNLQKRLDKVKQALTIQEAKDKLSKAEKSKKKTDIDAAQGAVNKVTDTTEKKNLQKRLDKVKQSLLVKDAKDRVGKAEKSKTKKNVDDAQKYIKKLANGKDKTALQKRLDKVKQSQIKTANDLMKSAEKKVNDYNIKKAQNSIKELPSGRDKDKLQKRLDKVKTKAADTKKLNDAKSKVKKAEKDKKKKSKQSAQAAVNKLKSSNDKKSLQKRINAIKVKK
ncbi:S8 family serine peptidase [Terribacillus saccharophilus]|uniref:S8 family peptidase n=1 Tax=Terribacillus saccharophilus TaxID=361277 RepID=UPI0039824A9F